MKLPFEYVSREKGCKVYLQCEGVADSKTMLVIIDGV